LKPYVAGVITNVDDMIRFREATLDLELSYISARDHIKNYTGKMLMNQPMAGSAQNQTKKHPFEDLVVSSIVRTATEDVLDALFHAERNPAVLNPLGCFDGYDKLIDDMIVSTEISVAKKNLVNTGAIVAPVDDTDFIAVQQLVDFVRPASRLLRNVGILYISQNVYNFAIDALENKFKYKDWDLTGLERYINEKASARIKVVVSDEMGTGDRIILTVAANFHFGMNTFTDIDFVQVRNPWEDPNEVQFWLQAEFGTRIVSIHPKEFQINDGTPVSNELSGDYKV